MSILQKIHQAKQDNKQLLAVLIDPEKMELEKIPAFIKLVNQSIATHIFVGGSTDKNNQTEAVVSEIKRFTLLPVILFPGDGKQITNKADGILFLSLISGRNPEFLIQQQVDWALETHQSKLEVLPTGYILVDGGNKTTVQKVSKTNPISQNNPELILRTALAGQFSGKQLMYLEAGSGATEAVGQGVINLVSKNLDIPLIVGGGIRSKQQMEDAYNAGANMVVIGTAFENNPEFLTELQKVKTLNVTSSAVERS